MAEGIYTSPMPVLKATHHGSNTSSTPLFLSRFPPKIAVIQVGADNPYGHPTPETLDRLQRTGAKIFRKDEQGGRDRNDQEREGGCGRYQARRGILSIVGSTTGLAGPSAQAVE